MKIEKNYVITSELTPLNDQFNKKLKKKLKGRGENTTK